MQNGKLALSEILHKLFQEAGFAMTPTPPQGDARVIKTHHIFPPIPIRAFDWCAYYNDSEETGPYGYGPTEAEAIADLKDNS